MIVITTNGINNTFVRTVHSYLVEALSVLGLLTGDQFRLLHQ